MLITEYNVFALPAIIKVHTVWDVLDDDIVMSEQHTA